VIKEQVLVIGSNGLLGQKVLELFVRGSANRVAAASVEERPILDLQAVRYFPMDITSRKDVKQAISMVEPSVIINCAAMTNVDLCETEREKAWKINVDGVENIVESAKKQNIRVVHLSTDYIFDGKGGPYGEEDRPSPLNYYGKTKLASENVLLRSGIPHIIVRTMTLYGFAEGVRPNFPLWLLGNLEQGRSVSVVDDQFGNPTLVDDLAFSILKAVELGKTGIFNIAGREIVSRYEFATRIARTFAFSDSLIRPIKTADLDQPAPRPLRSGLVTLKAEVELGFKPSTVDEGLAVLRNQLMRFGRWVADKAAVAGHKPGRTGPGKW
jgi:dTDP-4-dehydrorhamnose reductase